MSGVKITKGKRGSFGIGQHVHRGPVYDLSVDEHHEAVVWERPSQGGRTRTAVLQAGSYGALNLRYRWLGGDSARLIEVRATEIERSELLEVVWWHQDGRGKQRKQIQTLAPGTFSGRDNADFTNDRIEDIRVPASGSAVVYEHADEGGRYVTLEPGHHRLRDYDLYKAVSSIVFKLDAWEEDGIEFGDIRDKHKVGQTQVSAVDIQVPQGRSSVSIGVDRKKVSSVETHWEASASITNSAEVTVKTGAAEIKQSVSATVGASGGESESKGDESGFNVSVHVEPGPDNRVKGTLAVDLYEAVVPMKRWLRNKRTGRRISQDGEARATYFESTGDFV